MMMKLTKTEMAEELRNWNTQLPRTNARHVAITTNCISCKASRWAPLTQTCSSVASWVG